MKILLLHISSNYPLFLSLHRFALVFAETSFEVQRKISVRLATTTDMKAEFVSLGACHISGEVPDSNLMYNGKRSIGWMFLRILLPSLIHPKSTSIYDGLSPAISLIRLNVMTTPLIRRDFTSDPAFGRVHSKKIKYNVDMSKRL
jgi:hypothetical protein